MKYLAALILQCLALPALAHHGHEAAPTLTSANTVSGFAVILLSLAVIGTAAALMPRATRG